MPAGIQVWDASGNLIVDIADRLGRFIGAARVDGANNGQVSDAKLLQGSPFFSFQPDLIWGYVNMDVSRPVFSMSGQTIAWVYSAGAGTHNMKIAGWLFYGVQ